MNTYKARHNAVLCPFVTKPYLAHPLYSLPSLLFSFQIEKKTSSQTIARAFLFHFR